jgi:hypothetical protein
MELRSLTLCSLDYLKVHDTDFGQGREAEPNELPVDEPDIPLAEPGSVLERGSRC